MRGADALACHGYDARSQYVGVSTGLCGMTLRHDLRIAMRRGARDRSENALSKLV
jgi:hypothetical protein